MSVVTSTASAGPSTLLRQAGRWWLLAAMVLVFIAFATLRPQMAQMGTIATILRSASLTALMVLGLTGVVAAGKIDVSFMQIAALANMTAAGLVVGGAGWPVAALAAVALGAGVGALNGLLVGPARFQPLIVTIATGGICGSVAAAIGKGTSLRIDDAGPLGAFLALSVGPIPAITVATAIFYLAAWVFQDRLTFGRYVYALEQNEEAVREAGVPTARLTVLLYVLSGLFAAAAGVMLAASLQSGQPMIGASYFVDGLIAVLLGGMARMGRPNVWGTAVTAVLLACLVSGGALMGWADWQLMIIKGALLAAGVTVAVRMDKAQSLLGHRRHR